MASRSWTAAIDAVATGGAARRVRALEVGVHGGFAAGDLEPEDTGLAHDVQQPHLVLPAEAGERALAEVAVFATEVAA